MHHTMSCTKMRSLQRYRATWPELTDWLLPLKGTAGGDVSANKQTSERNDAKLIISANTGHRATFWVINIDTDPSLAKLIIQKFETMCYNRLYNYCNFVHLYQCVK